jgi:hypothetical protein
MEVLETYQEIISCSSQPFQFCFGDFLNLYPKLPGPKGFALPLYALLTLQQTAKSSRKNRNGGAEGVRTAQSELSVAFYRHFSDEPSAVKTDDGFQSLFAQDIIDFDYSKSLAMTLGSRIIFPLFVLQNDNFFLSAVI